MTGISINQTDQNRPWYVRGIMASPLEQKRKLAYEKENNPKSLRTIAYLFRQKMNSDVFSKTELKCGNFVGNYVSLVDKGGRLSTTGYATCKGRYCPSCIALLERRLRNMNNFIIDSLVGDFDPGFDVGIDKESLVTLFVTLTVPHYKHMDLESLLGSQKAKSGLTFAYKRFSNRGLLKMNCFLGMIRRMEVTYGEFGFNPHYHLLMFIDKNKLPKRFKDNNGQVLLDKLKDLLFKCWDESTALAGFSSPSKEYGVHVKQVSLHHLSCSAKYLTKWDMLDEISYSNIKLGRSLGFSLFELQHLIARDLATSLQYMAVQEWIKTFKRLKVQTIACTGIAKKLQDAYKTKEHEYLKYMNPTYKKESVVKAIMSKYLFRRIDAVNGFKEINEIYKQTNDIQKVQEFILKTYGLSITPVFLNPALLLSPAHANST